MNSTFEQETLCELQRINDRTAAGLVSEQALIELKEAILDVPLAPARTPRRVRRGWVSRPVLVLAGAAALAGVAVGVEAVIDNGPAGTQVADAAVLRGALAALSHPGSILIESYTGISRVNPKYGRYAPGTRPTHIQTYRFSQREITETPAGKGAQNTLNLGGSGVSGGREIGEVNGTDELYVPQDNTVYLTSQYGHSINKGPRLGAFVYTQPRIANAPAGSAAAEINAHRPAPLTITAAQARALRNGTATVKETFSPNGKTAPRLKLAPAFRESTQNTDVPGTIRSALLASTLHLAGTTTHQRADRDSTHRAPRNRRVRRCPPHIHTAAPHHRQPRQHDHHHLPAIPHASRDNRQRAAAPADGPPPTRPSRP